MNRRPARSRARWLPEAPVTGPFGSRSPLLPERAFVVHLRDEVQSGAARAGMAGRVEHVVSGRSVEFASLVELSLFMKRMRGRDVPQTRRESPPKPFDQQRRTHGHAR